MMGEYNNLFPDAMLYDAGKEAKRETRILAGSPTGTG